MAGNDVSKRNMIWSLNTGHKEEKGSANDLRFELMRQEIRKRSSLGETRMQSFYFRKTSNVNLLHEVA